MTNIKLIRALINNKNNENIKQDNKEIDKKKYKSIFLDRKQNVNNNEPIIEFIKDKKKRYNLTNINNMKNIKLDNTNSGNNSNNSNNIDYNSKFTKIYNEKEQIEEFYLIEEIKSPKKDLKKYSKYAWLETKLPKSNYDT